MEEQNNLKEQFLSKKIGVLLGGPSSEQEISKKTGAAILAALKRQGYNAVSLEVTDTVGDLLRQHSIDVAFIALHGSPGEDGTIQGMLEILRIPYTGSGVLASALSLNKVAAKKIFFYHGLPTPAFQSFRAEKNELRHMQTQLTIPLPCVIKPADEGSTLGVNIVEEKSQIMEALKKAHQQSREILIETFIPGRELTVGVLNDFPLPIVEIKPKGGFYDYKSKYTHGETEYIVSPDILSRQADELKDLAVMACHVLGCKNVARVDFILDANGSPFILEVNTIPGMTETSLLPMAAKQAGINFDHLVEKILWGASLHTPVRLG